MEVEPFGFAAALVLARGGHDVFATMRHPDCSPDLQSIAARESLPITVLPLDVDRDESVKQAIEQIMAAREEAIADIREAIEGYIVALEQDYYAVRIDMATSPGSLPAVAARSRRRSSASSFEGPSEFHPLKEEFLNRTGHFGIPLTYCGMHATYPAPPDGRLRILQACGLADVPPGPVCLPFRALDGDPGRRNGATGARYYRIFTQEETNEELDENGIDYRRSIIVSALNRLYDCGTQGQQLR